MDIVFKEQADELGLSRYFTGLPCKNGHISERRTSDGDCIACRKSYRTRQSDVIAVRRRAYRKKPEVKARRKRPSKADNLRWKYGLTMEEYEHFIDLQENCCLICETLFNEDCWGCVDHCHETDTVRGILCNNCNTALGMMKENPTALRLMADYIEVSKQIINKA